MVDLHIHSNYSDGLESINRLLEKIKDFDYFSITDHDNIESSKEQQLIKRDNYITGAEFSINGNEFSLPKKELHFLAYNYDPNNKKLNNMVDEFRDYNNLIYDIALKESIIENRLKIDFNALGDYNKRKVTISKMHLIKYLIEKGYDNKDLKDFQKYYDIYNKYVSKFCNRKLYRFTFDELLQTVKSAGGYIFLAHPFVHDIDKDALDKLFHKLVDKGIDGVEIAQNHGEKSCANIDIEKETFKYIDMYNLMFSLGSDYHGSIFKGNSTLGIDDTSYKDDKRYILNNLNKLKR